MKFILTAVIVIFGAGTAQAGMMDILKLPFRTLGKKEVKEFRKADGTIVRTASKEVINSRETIQNFNNALLSTTLKARNKLNERTYLSKQAITEVLDILPGNTNVRMHMVTVANASTKTIRTNLVVVVKEENKTLMRAINKIFGKQTDSEFAMTGAGLTKIIPVNLSQLENMNVSLGQLTDILNDLAHNASVKSAARQKDYLTKGAQDAYIKATSR